MRFVMPQLYRQYWIKMVAVGTTLIIPCIQESDVLSLCSGD